jgi:hypothetical protein
MHIYLYALCDIFNASNITVLLFEYIWGKPKEEGQIVG